MKVLHINTEKTWRGGERQSLWSLQGLAEAGVDAQLLCLTDSPLARQATMAGIKTHSVANQAMAAHFLLKSAQTFDVLHAQTGKGHNLAVFSRWAHSRPVVYTRRVDFMPRGRLKKWVYRHTNQVIAISEAIHDVLSHFVDVPIEIIPSMVKVRTDIADIRCLLAKRAERGQTGQQKKIDLTGKKIIATTTALVGHKDPQTMVAAIDHLHQWRQDFIFLHFGSGKLFDEISQKIKDRNLSQIYHLLGFVPEATRYVHQFDLFAMSSSQEGLGSSVLDAFLYRVPVVSTDAGGLKETVQGRGLLSPVRDAYALAKNMHRILDDSELRQRLTDLAYNDVMEKYAVQPLMQRNIEIYQRLLYDK